MPTLKQITCGIELGPGNIRLKEYGHEVTDGAVEVYIVSPETSDLPFHVRITSEGYIAPGLSAYVFIDGEYQCNRNRLRLRFPEDGASSYEYEIDFNLRQKEEKTGDGTFIARDWFFTPLGISKSAVEDNARAPLIRTATADKVPNTKNFQDNVGTIEVVILRCKYGGGEEVSTDPAQTTVSRNPKYSTRASSVRMPSAHTPSVRVMPTAESDKGSIFGGMMRIFDGAADDPGYYKQYRPRNIVSQEHLPGHKWDPSSGKYRYANDQDPFVHQRDQGDSRYGGSFPAGRYSTQTYTVGGGFSYQESEQPQEKRPCGPKVFVPQSSPGYDFSARRRKTPAKDLDRAPESTYDFTRSRKHENGKARPARVHQEQASERSEQREESGSGLAFIEDCSHRLKELIEHFAFEVEKYNGLKDDADRYYDRKVIYDEMLKAAHRKYNEVLDIMNGMGGLYSIVKQSMDTMNRETWRQASDLLYERNLYPPPSFQVDPPNARDEEGRIIAPPPHAENNEDNNSDWRRGGGFEQVGEGTAGKNKEEAEKALSNTGWGNDISRKSNSGSAKESRRKSGDGWSDHGGSNMPGAWNDDNDKEDAGGWDNNKANEKPTSGWGNDEKPKAKSDKANRSRGGNADKRSRHGSRHEESSKSHPSGPINDGAGSECHSLGDQQPKPVIKPYWSEWTKKQVMAKPKVQPREVYEYPALPLPTRPSGRATKGITQAVHAGRGVNYAHKLHRPEYLDTMSKPYAIFTFKYRNKAELEAILKHKVDDSNISEAKAQMKRQNLLAKSKDELIEELMRKTSIAAQSRASTKAASNNSDDHGATNEKPASPKRPSGNWTSPPKAVAKRTWDEKTEVKPSDSVSQHDSKCKSASGWGNGAEAKAKKNDACNKGSHHDQQPDTPRGGGLKNASAWAAAGWDSAVKSAKKGAGTECHFGNDAELKQTALKKKSKVSHAGW